MQNSIKIPPVIFNSYATILSKN